jgi:hypothetical protein
MDARLALMVDLEKALNMFEQANLYAAGLAFFSALGYHVKPLKTAINESMFRFVYIISKNRCVFRREETHAMESVTNISWLFSLDHHDESLWKKQRVVRFSDTPILSINYFCVEMKCSWRDRSIMAAILTKIISKVVNNSVVVLFKHANHLLLACGRMIISKNQSSLRVYLSDWYVIDPIQEEVLYRLSDWDWGNFSNNSLDDFILDWIYLMARPYFRNIQEYECKYKKYKYDIYNSCGKWDWSYYESDRLLESDYRYQYGYDYVSLEECYEVLEDYNNWVITDMIKMMEESAVTADDKDRFKQPTPSQIKHSGPDINGIDEDILSDPVKLLSYLESLDKRM